jgi:BirA family transcriptional regulator, biotin operon repressor / biotin---[acetyl-CoA-carboxylase] ligase
LSYTANMLADSSKGFIGNRFTELPVVDSTNNYAMAKVREGQAFHGNVFFAHEQVAGKGQFGKKWEGKAGQNIMMSIVIEPFLKTSNQFHLSISIACGCIDFLRKYISAAEIKWPNDLYWQKRKLGGILIENIVQGEDWKTAVIGIGININQTDFPEHLPNPVSLQQITGVRFPVIGLAKELCSAIEIRYNQLREGDFTPLLIYYNDNLFNKGQSVSLKQGNKVFQTKVISVSQYGQLHTLNHLEQYFNFGEVEWLIR